MLARDQGGAGAIYYELLRRGQPVAEIMAGRCASMRQCAIPSSASTTVSRTLSTTTIACLLSSRAAINLQKILPDNLAGLPLAQTIWYVLREWACRRRRCVKAPGHCGAAIKCRTPSRRNQWSLAQPKEATRKSGPAGAPVVADLLVGGLLTQVIDLPRPPRG